jgi:hypothetical protein
MKLYKVSGNSRVRLPAGSLRSSAHRCEVVGLHRSRTRGFEIRREPSVVRGGSGSNAGLGSLSKRSGGLCAEFDLDLDDFAETGGGGPMPEAEPTRTKRASQG